MWETRRLHNFRVSEHYVYVRDHLLDKATVLNFNLPGHTLADLTVTIIEQSIRNRNNF